jgi:hypothetical protein
MNNELLMDAISCLDGDLLAEHLKRKEELRRKPRRSLMPVMLKWSAIAASLVLTVTSVLLISEQLFKAPPDDPPISTDQPTDNNATLPIVTEKPTEENTSRPTDQIISADAVGISVANKLYFIERKLTIGATKENVGEFLCYLEDIEHFKIFLYQQNNYQKYEGDISNVKIYEYIPDDEKTNRIIIPFEERFYVLDFYGYLGEEMEIDDFVELLESVKDIDIVRDTAGEPEDVYSKPADLEGLIDFLKRLTENRLYTSEELSEYYKKFDNPWKEECYIYVILDDNTDFGCYYSESYGIFTIYGHYGYVLTREQMDEINFLIKGE